MRFVDHVEIMAKGGHGGPGAVSFRREKYVPKGGPDGGTGGNGGSVILVASAKLQTLMDLKLKSRYKAPAGNPGSKKNQTGSSGKNLLIEVPCGTLIFDQSGHQLADLTHAGDEYIAAKGGRGGLGNKSFATSTNQAPRQAQPGTPGEEITLRLELRLIAQVGLIGMPNAGKSTLLKCLTKAEPRIADFPFTTQFPNLGILRTYDKEIIIADIPGLIEGASTGLGLGDDFLRHIDRTKFLVHLVAVDPESPESTWRTFDIIRKEISKSDYELDQKPTIVVLSKIDIIDPQLLSDTQALFDSKNIATLAISSLSRAGISTLSQRILDHYESYNTIVN